jgi:4-hydroxy-3-methylbut-2-enyl diphosphate reductase
VQRAVDIPWQDMDGVATLGLTAGASAPDVLIEEVINALRANYNVTVEEVAITKESVIFNIPRLLREAEDHRASTIPVSATSQ